VLDSRGYVVSAGGPDTIASVPWRPGAETASLVQLTAVLDAMLANRADVRDLLADYITTL
jgi:hypothetical protein